MKDLILLDRLDYNLLSEIVKDILGSELEPPKKINAWKNFESVKQII